ncbi:MAG: prepilin-type N-terminal cleavage/methylation domain-containing protein [bacterium]|jgi:prepilin-type N-terminal cleavage/methylation domain-containing protein|nr:MAG: hypothetical protein DIU52_12190 [bacterium]
MNRRGFTIIELMVAIAIFAIVLGAGLQLLGAQSRGMARGADRVGATQNLQYAASILTRDLRTIGTSVPAGQPFLVYADSEVVAFNADYATNLVGDPSAVYYDPDAPPGSVMALTPANQITIPRSSFTYPRTTYTLPDGSNSPAELIIFYFQPDVTTPRPDDYVLMRQVNDRPPEVVARNLVRSPDGRPFFQYFRLVSTSSGIRVDSVLPNALPLAHSALVHGSPADVGPAAVIDSIRGVRISIGAAEDRPGASPAVHSVSRIVWLRNAGLAQLKICGSEPIFGSIVTAAVIDNGGAPAVELTWTPAVDEFAGEQDVIRYVVWRRKVGEPEWGDPYRSVPGGVDLYVQIDEDVEPGATYEYAVAAQDCTPTLSSPVTVGPVGPITLP